MKNTKKIISLVLAICMLASLAISASAANTVDASGGTGTSSVTLSSTADGSIGGDPAATKMSVTVPTVLPIAVGTNVHCALCEWIVDPEAAEIVKRIFAMTIDGYGPYQIAARLKEEKVLIPSAHFAKYGEGVNKNKTFKDVYGWGSSAVVSILKKREYLGHTCNFKTRKHFKDKKSHYVPEDEWTIFENTHEAIIDQETFDLVQKIRGNVRRYPDGWGEAAPLTGLLYCADCGGKMYVHRVNNGKRISQYTCSQYSKIPVGTLCSTQHRINEDVVLTLISDILKAIAEYAKHDRAEFIRVVQEAQSSQQTAEVRKQRTRLAAARQRISELEVLLCKIYEDNILGKLSDSRYATLDAQYEKEQTELTAEISALEKAISDYEKHEKDADRFIALIDKYENFDELTIAPIPLSSFAGQPSSSIGMAFIKSYAAICLEGCVILLACVIFSQFASSPPVITEGLAPATVVWNYIGELVFNMLVLVGSIKMSDRIIRELMGLG